MKSTSISIKDSASIRRDLAQASRENAHQKVLRLLRSYNREVVPEEQGVRAELILKDDGSGHLWLANNDGCINENLFGFRDTDELIQFLEAGELKRTRMIVAWLDRER